MEFIICPISFEFWFFLFISFSNSCSNNEFFADTTSNSPCTFCISRYFSYRVCFSSLSLVFSLTLASSISILIYFFRACKFWFSLFKLLNLSCKSSMPLNPSLSPDLSWTTDSRNVENILCLCRSRSFSSRFCYFAARTAFSSSISFLFFAISAFSFANFSYSFCLLSEFCCRITVFSVTSFIIFCCSSLYFCLYASSSLARLMMSSFWLVKFSSVCLSSFSFWRRRTAWSGR